MKCAKNSGHYLQTWLYRYKSRGVTAIKSKTRKDKGMPRKVTPEELMEALNIARDHFNNQHPDKMSLYRYCIEKGLLRKEQIAQTTFYRFIREYELLKDDDQLKNKKRLAFCMQYANQLWQGDTCQNGQFIRSCWLKSSPIDSLYSVTPFSSYDFHTALIRLPIRSELRRAQLLH